MKIRVINQNPQKVAMRQLKARLARQTQALATLRGMVGGKTLPLDDAGRGEAEYCGRAGCL